ncbi:MAG: GHMP kinase [Lentisphaerae bacterium]|nr:GHMP kinase [Lentisphaerota bacterium]
MVFTRTPFRVSFTGGGTDLPAFTQHEQGAVFSTTISKYMYITIKPMSRLFKFRIRVAYSRTELVNEVEDIEHPIVKAALQYLDIDEPLEIISMADIPAKTGLGSSSSFTVGLLHALHAYKGNLVDSATLARQACEIEINIVGDPIGKQDQYAAAYGGLLRINFNTDGSVDVNRLQVPEKRREELEQRLVMFYLGGTRSASHILKKQGERVAQVMDVMRNMRDMASEAADIVAGDRPLNEFGLLLHKAWEAKRSLAEGITSSLIDDTYNKALHAGAVGGKLLGAGGQGFMLFYIEPEDQPNVCRALSGLPSERIKFAEQGTTVIYKGFE